MKIRLSLVCIAMVLAAVNVADAQLSQTFSDQVAQPPAFQPVSGDVSGVSAGWPGRVWFEANAADNGLGFSGSYLTLGGKTRLLEDRFDGRWLLESELHQSIDNDGGFFANVGLERVFSIDAAGADVSMSVWYDYDGDAQGDFSHNFSQVGASAQIKTRKWDLIGNGYFPVGVTDYTFGDITGANCFVGNNIVIMPGIDSALEGFDVTLRTRPSRLAFVNGTVDFGGYQYSSDLINAFAGGRVRVGVQAIKGMILSGEINYDERFKTTGLLSVGWIFGANHSGYGNEYSGLARDLEQTVRNDHIVRFNQDVVLAIDPETGLPYNVIHVDNTADPGFENGTAETPFASLVGAEVNSGIGDIILVNPGDGTDRNMDQGIALQDNQRLYGNGSPLLIPVQDGQFFELCSDPSGVTPTISNGGGFSVVTLANNNDVAGLNIDATNAQFGVFGNGVNSGTIRDNDISNANEDGVRLVDISGDWNFSRNTISNNGRDGLWIFNALDPTSQFLFDSNVVNDNTFDGIHMRNYDFSAMQFVDNTTSNNLRHGLFLEDRINTTGAPLFIQGHVADSNVSRGVFLSGGSGNLRVIDSNITGNGGSGVFIRNWTNLPNENILVSASVDGTSNISGNGALGNLEFLLDLPGATSNIFVTDQTLDGGVNGLYARADGINTTLNIGVIDNLSISGNTNSAIRMFAFDGAVINTQISNSVENGPLLMLDNAGGGGDAIGLLAQGPNGQIASRINALIDNVTINNIITAVPGVFNTTGIRFDSLDNGLINAQVQNSTIGGPAQQQGRDTQLGIFANFDNTGNQLVNRLVLDNLTLFSDIGVTFNTGTETYGDLVLSNSTILPNGTQSTGVRADNTPFTGDPFGTSGVVVNATGQAILSGDPNMFYGAAQLPGGNASTIPEISINQIVTDGVTDNLTRIHLEDNTIQDFDRDGVDITTTGDAEMLVTLTGNQISNNGAGLNNDANNNNVFFDQVPAPVADPNNLLFWDGVNVDAFDQSKISLRINNNQFFDNFERGLSLNTFNSATINASMIDNVFFGNDRGEDVDNTLPPIGTGIFANTPALTDSGIFSFEAINNEEFYFRDYESLVLIDITGALVDTAGMALPADTLGVFFPGNTGINLAMNPVADGVATMNLDMSSNSFQLGVDLIDFSVPPGDFQLGLDGATNGFIPPVGNTTTVGFGTAEASILAEELFFFGNGFLQPTH